jgi:hypothetical protein
MVVAGKSAPQGSRFPGLTPNIVSTCPACPALAPGRSSFFLGWIFLFTRLFYNFGYL